MLSRVYGVPASDEVPPVAGDELLPEVDEALAEALVDQGEDGTGALGLLRDARSVLVGGVLERPA
ncbi:hypothetical protein [Actinacidiphila oryziradicis]|uniref:hypothetical protein n=1 Tax=Actinacidiphila oryziradicis TaxID=2571141 RepID=UPI0023F08259|nr:hypothetical protein [Actinacidiphila oryziradicis]MCW2871848.1 hypothetical protein [Actinacidiphila oryziradicis]